MHPKTTEKVRLRSCFLEAEVRQRLAGWSWVLWVPVAVGTPKPFPLGVALPPAIVRSKSDVHSGSVVLLAVLI